MALWFGLANGWDLLAVVLSAAALHELGHLLVLWMRGAEVTGLRISVFGAELNASCTRLSYAGELAAVLAGPVVNLCCGLLLALLGQSVPAGAHIVLGMFNLLPIRPLDGGRALELMVSWAAGPAAGAWAARWIGACAAMSLATVAIWIMWRTGGSLWLLPAAAGALGIAVRESEIFVK